MFLLKISRVLSLGFICLTVSACGSLPPMNFSVPNVGPSQTKLQAELKSLTVSVARPDEKTGDLPMWAAGTTTIWKTAVEDALNKMAIFKDDSSRKVALSIKILKLDAPSAGFDMTTDSAARYEIIDRNDGSIIFTTDIEASGTCPIDYAFLGATRSIESVNRSVQNNISKFLIQLETADMAKPIFPAKVSLKSKEDKK